MKGLTGWVLGAVCAVGLAGCCCGSDFQEGFKEGFQEGTTENFQELEGKLAGVEDSPEKEEVAGLIADAQKPENSANIGFTEQVAFIAAFEEAVQDKAISADERDNLKKLYDDAVAAP